MVEEVQVAEEEVEVVSDSAPFFKNLSFIYSYKEFLALSILLR